MKKIITVLLVAFIMIQFFPIDKTNPEINPKMDFVNTKQPPVAIAKILKTSCYDCHSNETRYPWYASIAPSSWFLKKHIDEGRKKLNFSTWATYEPKRQLHKLDENIEMLEKDEMPLESYILGHPDAKLTTESKKLLIEYFRQIQRDTKEANPIL
ncbi:heme-binding domain-containing protein [Chryseobacterium sp. POL2]|uniref:heme-binding domain-containing protein n=1 Tax=Chryseobacterium sp. POL2 TaxID=2713414 RepID=UPI0013E1E0F9|nr:heme-binding domain-containing protein [Chryseobacterium sp. POL2]QIG89220.1 heme-binding domain-containing protein [Chryseobacterium sp. POL2]